MIKIRFVKQKLTGLCILIFALIMSRFLINVEVTFLTIALGLYGLWFLLSKSRFYSHDYIFTFDIDKFRGLR